MTTLDEFMYVLDEFFSNSRPVDGARNCGHWRYDKASTCGVYYILQHKVKWIAVSSLVMLNLVCKMHEVNK